MPAVSKAQQRFMGMVHAAKKGKLKSVSPQVARAAKSMTTTQTAEFAGTKHKGLPDKLRKEALCKLARVVREFKTRKHAEDRSA